MYLEQKFLQLLQKLIHCIRDAARNSLKGGVPDPLYPVWFFVNMYKLIWSNANLIAQRGPGSLPATLLLCM